MEATAASPSPGTVAAEALDGVVPPAPPLLLSRAVHRRERPRRTGRTRWIRPHLAPTPHRNETPATPASPRRRPPTARLRLLSPSRRQPSVPVWPRSPPSGATSPARRGAVVPGPPPRATAAHSAADSTSSGGDGWRTARAGTSMLAERLQRRTSAPSPSSALRSGARRTCLLGRRRRRQAAGEPRHERRLGGVKIPTDCNRKGKDK